MSDPDPIPFDNSFDNSPDIPPAPRHSGIRYLAVVLFLGLVGVAGFLGAPYLKEFFRSPSPPVASTRKATENETVFQKPPLAPDPSRYAGIEIGGSAVKFVILRNPQERKGRVRCSRKKGSSDLHNFAER